MFKINKSSIVILVISVWLVATIGSEVFYRIFYLIFFSLFFSIIWCILSKRNIIANQEVDIIYCTTDEEINLQTVVENKSVLPIPFVEVDKIFILENNFKKEYFSLMPFEKVIMDNKINFKYRGIYSLGPIEIKLWDVFGIICFEKSVDIGKSIYVYPKIHYIDNLNLPNFRPLGTHKAKSSTNEDYTSIRNIRGYVVGDNLKRVHWKLSAKRGELQIKEYDISGTNSVNIILDMTEVYKSFDLEETAAEVCISIVEYLLRNRVETILYIVSNKLYSSDGKNINDFKKLSDLIATVRAEGSIDVIDVVKDRIKLNKDSTILYITGSISSEKLNRLNKIKEYINNFYIVSCDDTEEKHSDIVYIVNSIDIKGGFMYEK
ncbi:MAG: hypothetical protein JG776_1989 [Caloramator sp.]|jgi:uncharacterized protein (DUF58 family)|uniref:DUF58 domain-containing protein n=1 Tax=Caloramator sp. TaxID=1871330 RepID=UPI001D2BCFE9|nr:DUF58 domain-containing protein [Caloramator sp.]MBZ4664271.1 hypothetical protein [Caloramator sp.]